jgi:20S proteasome alpha/beta subunit
MTCVVGIETGKSVLLGADSSWCTDAFIMSTKTPKIFRKGEFVIGFAGGWMLGVMVHHRLVLPSIGRDANRLDHYMNTRFVDALNALIYKEGEEAFPEDNVLIVGVRGELYEVNSELCAIRANGWTAIGEGDSVAVGALHSTEGLGLDPQERLRRALEATAAYITTVCPPFTYVSNVPARLSVAKSAKRTRK